MSEEPENTPHQDPPHQGNNGDSIEKQAFLDRLKEESDKRKSVEAQLKELSDWKEQREKADMTELERARSEAETAREQLKQAQDAQTKMERQSLVRDAAGSAGFADPSDAVAFADLSEIEDAKAAKRAVEQIAKSKPHLLQKQTQGFGGLQAEGESTGLPGIGELGRDRDGNPDWREGLSKQLLQQLRGHRGG